MTKLCVCFFVFMCVCAFLFFFLGWRTLACVPVTGPSIRKTKSGDAFVGFRGVLLLLLLRKWRATKSRRCAEEAYWTPWCAAAQGR